MRIDVSGFKVETEAIIEAPREEVFDAMLALNEWFPHRFKPGSPYVQETNVGGLGYESWPNGEGALFSITTYIQRPDIWVVMDMPGVFGPYVGTTTLRFTDVEEGTKLAVTVFGFGDLGEQDGSMFEEGWPGIFEDLRKYLAQKKAV